LVSFVQAQQPPRDIDKAGNKATDVKSEAKDQNKAQDKDNKATGDHDMNALQGARLQDLEGDAQSGAATQGSAKGKGGVSSKGSPNMAPSAGVSGDRQLAGTQNTSASPSGKKARKGALGRVFSRIFGGGGEKVDGSGGKTGAQRAGDGQDQPSGGQGQQPKGDKGAPGPKSQDDGGGR
jgi:hypothetical protein